MPREHRELKFSRGELRQALRELRRCYPERLPNGDIKPKEFGTDDGLDLKVAASSNGDGTAATLKAEEVAVALMLLCEKQSIPLPRRAQKRLEVQDGEAVLVLTLDG